jgi:hypothetical protein
VRPEALRQIEVAGISTDELRSKSSEDITRPQSPALSKVRWKTLSEPINRHSPC